MFQNLANYLLGAVTNQDQVATTTTDGVESSSSRNIRLRSVESEDDWIFVDRDSEGNSEVSSVDSLVFDDRLPLPLLTRTSSTSSLPCNSSMDESWFVTPPPCFTSAGPVHMETSPLENLLIEHPSMSVYQHSHSNRRHTVRTASPPSLHGHIIQVEDLEIEEIQEEGEEPVALVRRMPRVNRLQILQQQERQGIKSKKAQKMQVQKACETMKRGCLNRNNKAREVNSRNRRQRRGERSQGATRSYANNNRKC